MAAFEKVCREYLKEHRDSGLLMASISEEINKDENQIDNLSNILILPDNENILKENGWDLLNILTRYLKNIDTPLHSVICSIVNVSSAKEMYLALMEQFELIQNVKTFILLLPLLSKVIDKCTNKINTSTAVKELHVFVIKYIQMYIKGTLNEIAIEHQLHTNYEEVISGTTNDVTMISFTESCLKFLLDSVNNIDINYCSKGGVIIGTTSLQVYCIAHLLTLLDGVITSSYKVHHDTMINKVMENIMKCHFGAMKLFEWKNIERTDNEDDNETYFLSTDGLAHFAYLLIVCRSCDHYMPQIIHPLHLYKVCIPHVIQLLNHSSSHHVLTMNGLVLLESLQCNISVHSLCSSLLDQHQFGLISPLLCKLTIYCPFKEIRQKSLANLKTFIACFTSKGRYRMYQSLLLEVNHPGMQSWIIHQLKDEVHNSFDSHDSVFIGSSLEGLYLQFLTATSDIDVLSEFDRLIGGLNFMRYLLLKDDPLHDKSLIWKNIEQLNKNFIFPLRTAISNLQSYCNNRIKYPDQYKNELPKKEKIDIDVNVIGSGILPELTPLQELEILNSSLYRLDIILSVLVRVEELIK